MLKKSVCVCTLPVHVIHSNRDLGGVTGGYPTWNAALSRRPFPLPILGNCTAALGERGDGLAPGLPGDSTGLVSTPPQSHAQTYPESSGFPALSRFSGVNRPWYRSASEIACPGLQRKQIPRTCGSGS